MVAIPIWPRVPLWPQQKKHDLTDALALLQALGAPEQKLPSTIHIAGTNGKGSTLAMIRSIFTTAGYTVHSYTSPHLLQFNERINLAGEDISDYYLFELLEIVRQKAEELRLEVSFFEGTTIAAFLAFAAQPADLLILETGLGGRLDCTNVIEHPILTIITPISFDHTEHLGNSLQAIAREKAGIIKNKIPCIIAAQNDSVYQLLFDQCRNLNSPVFCYEYDYIIEETRDELIYRSQKHSLILPKPLYLLGKHQYLNLSTAVAATMLVNNTFKISTWHVATGIAKAKWPGRIELIDPARCQHLAGQNIKIYLDGAHNEAGSIALSAWIKDSTEQPVYMIIGMTKNRNVENFCQHFQGLITEARAVKVLSEPSSYSPEVIVNRTKNFNIKFQASESLDLAIKDVCNLNINQKATIIITGSLFLVSDFYKLLCC